MTRTAEKVTALSPPSTAPKPCCWAVVNAYEVVFSPARERASLYCPACHSRVVFRGGKWSREL